MFKKIPPYQLIAFVGSLLLVAYVLWAYRFSVGNVPGWTLNAAIFVAALVAAMTALGLWQLFSDYRKGYLFPLRNATLFLTVLSVFAIPVLVIWEMIQPGSLSDSTLLLLPVFLFMMSRNLFRVKVDNVALEAKLGLRKPLYIPLFNITRVEEDERGIIITNNDGSEIKLLRVFFFASHWARLRERLTELG